MATESTKRMLVVDDEPNVTMVVAASLRKLGEQYEIERAHSAEEALSKVQDAFYTLVITDYRMTGMNGLVLAQAIRELSPKTLVVLMTAYTISGMEERVAQGALDGFIQKPFTIAQIRSIVEEIAGSAVPAELEAEAQAAAEASKPPTRLARRILILDDDDGLRHLYSKALSYAGFTVHTAASLEAAQQLLKTFHFDAYLSDVRTGHEAGLELLRRQGESLSAQGTQVVIVSGEPHYRELSQRLGVDFFMTKPLSLESLMQLVSQLTGMNP